MELHLLIKDCVDVYGQDIIVSKRLIGLLDDKQAFDEPDTAAYKKILHGLVNDGYVQRFLDLRKYSSEVGLLASNYAQANLMQEAPVLYMLDCLAFGLGWISQNPVMKTTNSGTASVSTSNFQSNNSHKAGGHNSGGFFSRLFGSKNNNTSQSADECYQNAISAKSNGNSSDYIEWLKKAAQKGSLEAYLALGQYYNGNNAAQDYKEAIKWFNKGANKGNAACAVSLGFMYAYGHGTDVDYNKAISYFEAPAKAGNQRAQFGMGYCNYHRMVQLQNKYKAITEGSLRCYNEAKRWLSYLAEKGDANAQYYLGVVYNYTEFSSESDRALIEKSYEWLDKARKQGHKAANDYINRFGIYYWRGY